VAGFDPSRWGPKSRWSNKTATAGTGSGRELDRSIVIKRVSGKSVCDGKRACIQLILESWSLGSIRGGRSVVRGGREDGNVDVDVNKERGVRNETANDQDYQKRCTGEEAKLELLMLLMFSESGLVWRMMRELIRGGI